MDQQPQAHRWTPRTQGAKKGGKKSKVSWGNFPDSEPSLRPHGDEFHELGLDAIKVLEHWGDWGLRLEINRKGWMCLGLFKALQLSSLLNSLGMLKNAKVIFSFSHQPFWRGL